MKVTSFIIGLLISLFYAQISVAQTYQRGEVIAVSFKIKYPDGQIKDTKLSPEQVKNLMGISFDPILIKPEDMDDWNTSDKDWKQNPSMILYNRKEATPSSPLFSTPHCRWIWHYENGDW
jgi:hypothetical protein